jgi:hypothetical protein
MPRRSILFATLTLALLAPALHAQTLAQKQMMAEVDANFATKTPDTNKACGTSLKASIDWSGFLKSEIGQNSVSAFCAAPLDTLQSMCGDAMAKQAIAGKIKGYVCAFGGPGKRALSLDNGTLQMDVDWDASNYDDYIRGWLGDHL